MVLKQHNNLKSKDEMSSGTSNCHMGQTQTHVPLAPNQGLTSGIWRTEIVTKFTALKLIASTFESAL